MAATGVNTEVLKEADRTWSSRGGAGQSKGPEARSWWERFVTGEW